MKVCFVHDHPFFIKDQQVYSPAGLSYTVWNRYLLNRENHLTVYAREQFVQNKGVVSSGQNVTFKLSSCYKKPIHALLYKRRIEKEVHDLIVSNDVFVIRLPSILGFFAINECLKCNKKYVVEVVANAFDAYFYYGNILGKIIAPFPHLLTKYFVNKSLYVLYVTKFYLQSIYPAKNAISTISCSNVVLNVSKQNLLLKRLDRISQQSLSNTLVCGQIGNVGIKFKGYHVMLKAVKYLKLKYHIKVKYVIAGPGNSENLEILSKKLGIRDQIEFIGGLSREEIFEFLEKVDIYVHPSFQEGLPRAVIEAMSCACPCVTSNVAGTPELLSSEILHSPGDYKKLANDIYLLYNNVELRKKIC